MNQVTAKFYCSNAKPEDVPCKTFAGNGPDGQPQFEDVTGLNVQLYPVTSGGAQDGEDAAFARSTPSGQFWMRVMNNAILESGFFQAGKNYKITIEPAD